MSRWNKTRLAKYTAPFRSKGGYLYEKHADLVYHIRASSDSTIEDVSLNAHAVSESGSIILEPTTYLKQQVQKANNAKAMYFNGTDSLTIGTAADSTLSLGTGTANTPVSWSFWYRHGNTGTNLNYVMAKGGFNTETANDEYYIAFNNAGIMTLYVRDKDGTGDDYKAHVTFGSVGDPLLPGNHYGKWYHIVLTWDATGWATSDFAAYVNGTLRSNSDYTVTEGSNWDYAGGVATPETLKLGYNDDTTEGDVELALADVAFWRHSAAANVLSAYDAKALYESKFGVHSSGMLLDSPRLTQHDRDHATGSYPTIHRTGDHDFTGKFNVHYDDTNTIIYNDSYVEALLRIDGVPAAPNTSYLSRYLSLEDGEGVTRLFLFTFNHFDDPIEVIGVNTAYKVKLTEGMTPRAVAFALTDAINASSLKIFAESRGVLVKIIHTIPGLSVASIERPIRGHAAPATALKNIKILQDYSVTQDLPVTYPLMLASGSKALESIAPSINIERGEVDGYYLENQNRLPDIVASGSIKSHTNNSLLHFSPGESISPFDESRIAIGGIVNPQNTAASEDGGFYENGTRPDLVHGFNSKLASKTTLVFDINPSQRTDVWFSTGTNPAAGTHASSEAGLAAGIHSGLVYFNWDRKVWEPIGDFTTGSNVNYASLDNLSGSYLATAPMTRWPGITREDFIARGNLVSDAGFPFATKYHATGSQTFNLTGTISHPFLVEKITYIFSASFPTLSDGSNTNGFNVGVCNTILLMNQRSDNGVRPGSTISFKANKSQEEGDYQLSFTNDDAMRDVLSIGKMHRTETGHANPVNNGLKIEAFEDEIAEGTLHPDSFDELRHLHYVDGIAARTGSIHINTIPMTHMQTSQTLSIPCPSSPRVGSGGPYGSGERRKLRCLGSRGGNGSLVAGRNLVRTLVPKASTTKEHVTYDYVTVDWPATLSDLDSPYLLLPTDSLVLAFTNQRVPMTQTTAYYSNAFETEAQIADQKITLYPGAGKLILYGSLISNEREYHETRNEPLTSPAIHEALHFDNPVVDQWDVEPSSLFSGSYSDYITSGSMFINPLGELSLSASAHAAVLGQGSSGQGEGLARQVIGSTTNGDAYRSGSFSRWTRHFTSDEVFYDSMVPNPAEYLIEPALTTSGTNNPVLGVTLKIGSQPVGTASGSLDWSKRFPFEASGSAFGRLKFPILAGVPGSGKVSSISILGHVRHPIGLANLTGGMGDADTGNNVPQTPHLYSVGRSGTLDEPIEHFKLFYGIGRNGGLPSLFHDDNIDNISIDNGSVITEESPFVAHMGRVCVEGFKYGIYNLYMPSAICFRRDKFGQFRDILEQRPYARFFDTDDGLQQSAVEVKFVNRQTKLPEKPSSTHSQNLSTFATASVPYFDGVAKERDTIAVDKLLQQIEVI